MNNTQIKVGERFFSTHPLNGTVSTFYFWVTQILPDDYVSLGTTNSNVAFFVPTSSLTNTKP